MVVSYRHFGTTYRFHLRESSRPFFLDCLALEDGDEELSRNVGKKLHYTLRGSQSLVTNVLEVVVPCCLPFTYTITEL